MSTKSPQKSPLALRKRERERERERERMRENERERERVMYLSPKSGFSGLYDIEP